MKPYSPELRERAAQTLLDDWVSHLHPPFFEKQMVRSRRARDVVSLLLVFGQN